MFHASGTCSPLRCRCRRTAYNVRSLVVQVHRRDESWFAARVRHRLVDSATMRNPVGMMRVSGVPGIRSRPDVALGLSSHSALSSDKLRPAAQPDDPAADARSFRPSRLDLRAEARWVPCAGAMEGHHCRLISRRGHQFKHWPYLEVERDRAIFLKKLEPARGLEPRTC